MSIQLNKEELVQPFFYSGGSTGILLVHGFTASPIDVKPLGQKLAGFGYTIYAPLLPGHGMTPEELKDTTWADWLDGADKALKQLTETCDRIIAVGHSMGGLLALSLAANGRTDGVISINAPIIYQEKDLHFAEKWLEKQEYIEKPHKESEVQITREGLPHFSYTKVPVRCFVSLNQGIDEVKNQLGQIKCPVLLVQSLKDKTVHPRSSRLIEKSIVHRNKDVIYWANEDHYLPLSAERDKLAQKIDRFIVRYNLKYEY